ncbi:hypothetical protein [Clostridium sp. Marseille-Q2269]|uniref:hypothetical protein n=1 Tax=Clostridium sp. Marseille-Q2269 TaxID=2942205 RepID=UPI002074484D|nr:hypothetical protein [Clostridium sp. Marseille-Q2269]
MKIQPIVFIFLTLFSIHNLLKAYTSIKKGLRPNYLIIILALISLIASILGLILFYKGV